MFKLNRVFRAFKVFRVFRASRVLGFLGFLGELRFGVLGFCCLGFRVFGVWGDLVFRVFGFGGGFRTQGTKDVVFWGVPFSLRRA